MRKIMMFLFWQIRHHVCIVVHFHTHCNTVCMQTRPPKWRLCGWEIYGTINEFICALGVYTCSDCCIVLAHSALKLCMFIIIVILCAPGGLGDLLPCLPKCPSNLCEWQANNLFFCCSLLEIHCLRGEQITSAISSEQSFNSEIKDY